MHNGLFTYLFKASYVADIYEVHDMNTWEEIIEDK